METLKVGRRAGRTRLRPLPAVILLPSLPPHPPVADPPRRETVPAEPSWAGGVPPGAARGGFWGRAGLAGPGRGALQLWVRTVHPNTPPPGTPPAPRGQTQRGDRLWDTKVECSSVTLTLVLPTELRVLVLTSLLSCLSVSKYRYPSIPATPKRLWWSLVRVNTWRHLTVNTRTHTPVRTHARTPPAQLSTQPLHWESAMKKLFGPRRAQRAGFYLCRLPHLPYSWVPGTPFCCSEGGVPVCLFFT